MRVIVEKVFQEGGQNTDTNGFFMLVWECNYSYFLKYLSY